VLGLGLARQELPGRFVHQGSETVVQLRYGLIITSGYAMHEHPVLLAHVDAHLPISYPQSEIIRLLPVADFARSNPAERLRTGPVSPQLTVQTPNPLVSCRKIRPLPLHFTWVGLSDLESLEPFWAGSFVSKR